MAQGRVWTGLDAHRNGLVDALGGYDEAREVPALPKLTTPRDSALHDVLATLVRSAQEGVDHAAGRQALLDLWTLAESGERFLAYGWELPSLR
ncbi:MAG: Peptidase family [Pseudomonadota bacterium]